MPPEPGVCLPLGGLALLLYPAITPVGLSNNNSAGARVDKVAITSTAGRGVSRKLAKDLQMCADGNADGLYCPRCNNTFACIASALQHMQAVHNVAAPLPARVEVNK
ncbi:hypothetical protein HaLaN_21877 [Haematococcus lacustris]|uniref:C2H2-type domain-containing protein n=1 Tax=Haematococcus lacustris TaxID=44745 RepID=A0A699ZN88_HAELA|nr:hypothetical protein HaLaN_21877 [Haematococcus lacustris]